MEAPTPYPPDPRWGVTRDGRIFRLSGGTCGRAMPYEISRRSDKDGYLIVGQSKKGWKTLKVHRMVAETFIPNPDGLPEVAHRNGVRDDCAETNLRWSTTSSNHADKITHGTLPHGERHHWSRLTDAQVREARRLRKEGARFRELYVAYPQVHPATLRRAVIGATWRHV